MAKKILTQEDLDLNPVLTEQGLKAGDEYDFPEGENVTSSESLSDENPDPPGMEVPKKPPPPQP